jgi:hypothetical protein
MRTWWSGGNSDDDWIIVDFLPSLSLPPPDPTASRLGTMRQHRHDKSPCSDLAEKLPTMCVCVSVCVRLCVPEAVGSLCPKGF